MSTPHPESVVSVQIKNISLPLYNKLVTMEALCYDNPAPGTIADYKVLWTNYSNAWLTYRTNITLDKGKCRAFVMGVFNVISAHFGSGAGGPQLISDSDAHKVFNSSGVIDRVLGYPDTHYKDIVIPVPAIPPVVPAPVPNSPNMDLDLPRIQNAAASDIGKFDNLVEVRFPDVIGGVVMNAMFSDPVPPQVVLSKSAMWDMIFETLHWRETFTSMGHADVIPTRPN